MENNDGFFCQEISWLENKVYYVVFVFKSSFTYPKNANHCIQEN